MMHTPAPGWYPDPSVPTQTRWWDGQAWTTHTAPGAQDAAEPMATPVTVIDPASSADPAPASPAIKIAVALGGLLLAIGLAAAFAPGLLTALGIALLGVALFAVIKGSVPRLKIRSRMAGWGAMGVAFALVMTGGLSSVAQSDAPTASLQSDATKPQPFAQQPSSAPAPQPTPTTFEDIQETSPVPFERMSIDSDQYDIGTATITTAGVEGTKVTTIRITYVDGAERSREVVSETISIAPVTEITSHGTRQPPPPPAPAPAPAAPVPFAAPAPSDCHPSYAGVCVPNASDVDCEGGSGDGPAYARGPLQVVGDDVYDLDRDGDGIACD